MKKLESQKQLFEDVFAVEHIHSSKKKLVIRTDVFEDGIIVQKVSANCTMLYINDLDYMAKGDVLDGSIQIIFFPISEKELNKRFKLLANSILKKEELCGTKTDKI